MYSKLTQAILFAFMIPAVCCAQHHRSTPNGVEANINGNAIDIEFYSPSIVRVVKSPISHSFKRAYPLSKNRKR
jgi:alpha-D-xyloside xylohydrolase